MRKIKRFNLYQGQLLSNKELSGINGGESFPLYCGYVGQPCAVVNQYVVSTGICYSVPTADGGKTLQCIPN